MTVLHAGEIGRLNLITSLLDTDEITILSNGALFRITAAEAKVFFTTLKVIELTFADSPYSVKKEDDIITVNASGGNVIVDLLARGVATIKELNIKKVDVTANTVTVDAFNAEKIDGQLTFLLLNQFDNLSIAPSSIEWMKI